MPKKILVLGSKGFIGSAVLSFLKERGHDVFGVTDDIRNKKKIKPHLWNVDFVVHAAGESKDQNNEKLCFETNVIGTKNIIEACIENKCKLIHLSSTARKLAYGRSKQLSQQLVEDARGLRAVILRLCPIVTLDDPLMEWGRRYPLEDLVRDIEKIILTHDFKGRKVIDYKQFKKSQYEKSTNLH